MVTLDFERLLPGSTTNEYLLKDGGQVVGFIQIRQKPSHSPEVPPHFANHIYYEISPEFRGKGYGKQILKLGLGKAKEMGLDKVFLTAHSDNPASVKIIESNGGVLTDSVIIPSDGSTLNKFEIDLKK